MITVKLMGGLGNQLFQYAFGRSLSSDLNTKLCFDLCHYDSEYAKSKKHDFYNLQIFNINEINTRKFSNEIPDELSKLNYYQELSFNEKTGFPANRNLNNLQFPAYFEGYWQSEKYFMHNENKIRKDLQFNIPINGKNKVVAKDILDNNSIAMHIRRGDYQDNPQFGMCGLDYYKKSISFIEKQIEDPKFFIFSDDHQWVKENIKIPNKSYYVTHNSVEKGHEDLRLMSLCKHFIIANSSFSWWGAWLSQNKDKIVTIPKPWFICHDPFLRHIDNGKNYFPICNDHSEAFNKSNLILFELDPFKHSLDISSFQNVDLSVDKNMLNIHTLENDSKLYLKEIQKLNDNNDVILKISLKGSSSDVMRLYYTTKNSSEYIENNSFYFHYYKNENMNIYIPLSKDVLLTNLMISPSSIEGTNIIIESLEIREIRNSKIIGSKFNNKISKKISSLRKFLPS